jgi:hypothetical protein
MSSRLTPRMPSHLQSRHLSVRDATLSDLAVVVVEVACNQAVHHHDNGGVAPTRSHSSPKPWRME